MPTYNVNSNVGDTLGRMNLHSGMSLGNRIKQARLRAKLTQQQVADHFGIARVSVTQWESERARPDPRKLIGLTELFGVTIGYLLQGDPLPDDPEPVAKPVEQPPIIIRPAEMSPLVPAPDMSDQRLPVLGVGRGGDDGRFAFNGETVEYVARPPNLVGVKHAYAIYVVGESMVPRYRPGELVWVNPNKPADRYDDVVVQLHTNDPDAPPEGLIKEFRAWTPEKLHLWQYNPQGEVVFERKLVKRVHVIVGSLRY
ncbi:repressor [Camelimonas fluminis]|uniref:XRE family transcriptional regulator n=1 Tax=Camelimonas fluminis TaxID=1576911 RepID=A0ABV7UEY4_9HYPH|nr:LexA family transcriptional regulator [Camelimonas fluminis]GHE50869.1 repressor [Camelimonas fluminis]